MEPGLVREIERLQTQLRTLEDPEEDGSGLPPLAVDQNSIGRELRDALSDLLLARQQAKSLRESLRRKDEQNELMRKVNEQVQTVQQKLVAKEAELTRTHEETLRMGHDLRTLKSERATEQGQLEMLQWKLTQRERDLQTVDAELKSKDTQLQQVTAGKTLEEMEKKAKIASAHERTKKAVLVIFGAVMRAWTARAVHITTIMWRAQMRLAKAEKKHQSKMKRAKAKVEDQIKQVQSQVNKVMETCRATEAENGQLREELAEVQEKLNMELDKTEDLSEQLQHTEEEFEKLLGQLGA